MHFLFCWNFDVFLDSEAPRKIGIFASSYRVTYGFAFDNSTVGPRIAIPLDTFQYGSTQI